MWGVSPSGMASGVSCSRTICLFAKLPIAKAGVIFLRIQRDLKPQILDILQKHVQTEQEHHCRLLNFLSLNCHNATRDVK